MHDVPQLAPLERLRERSGRPQDQRVVYAHRGHVLADERVREAAAEDVEVGPLRH